MILQPFLPFFSKFPGFPYQLLEVTGVSVVIETLCLPSSAMKLWQLRMAQGGPSFARLQGTAGCVEFAKHLYVPGVGRCMNNLWACLSIISFLFSLGFFVFRAPVQARTRNLNIFLAVSFSFKSSQHHDTSRPFFEAGHVCFLFRPRFILAFPGLGQGLEESIEATDVEVEAKLGMGSDGFRWVQMQVQIMGSIIWLVVWLP